MTKFKPHLPHGYRCRCPNWSDARGCCRDDVREALAKKPVGELFVAINGVERLSVGG